MRGVARTSMFPRLFLAVLLCVSALVARAERVEDLPKPTDYVSDYAHVLSGGAVARLDRICAQLDHTAANAQVAIVTVRNLDGDDAADYANRLETAWKMGKKGSDRGVLLLLAVDDHKYRIDVGYGLEGMLNDARLGDFGRAMRPSLRVGDYDGAVLGAVGQVAGVIAADAKVTLDDAPGPVTGAHRAPGRAHLGFRLVLLLFLLIFFGGVFVIRLLAGFGLMNLLFGGRGPYNGGGGWGGGGFGGGDSGGGGGGFGGFGGGDFGGGGAGGDW